MKKKSTGTSSNSDRHVAAIESNVFHQLMPLVEHCCVSRYDDGDSRDTGWFTVKTQGAAWVVQVKDPDSGMSFASIAETLDKAIETACLLLACDEAPWQPDPFLKKMKAGRK